MVRMVAILNENGKRYYRGYKYDERVNNRGVLSRECRGVKDPEARNECVMFCFKEEVLVEMTGCGEYDCDTISRDGREKKRRDNQVRGIMRDLQATLGIPRRWGNYTGLLVFDVDRRKIYVPKRIGGGVYACKKDVRHDRIHKEKPLEFPFIGEGRTFVYGVKRKGWCWPKEGIEEYVLLSGTRMKNVMYYDTISKYCDHRKVCEGMGDKCMRRWGGERRRK